ncbi:YadA-like family protein [uncultured Mitsuokella sp.]|uniref:YadA-like family protein n=1 Tax=uncultured Mitsuokella sp. TaxID=453120 RepID=UPI00266FCC8E|nr:YadA-like family protein [uncultured Mitsuokella sp.]
MTTDGIDAANKKITNVAAGTAALAALHPLDFDPDDKWDFAVGYGNYRDANSVAVGAFYRPDEAKMNSGRMGIPVRPLFYVIIEVWKKPMVLSV